jgi:hypothetical protein
MFNDALDVGLMNDGMASILWRKAFPHLLFCITQTKNRVGRWDHVLNFCRIYLRAFAIVAESCCLARSIGEPVRIFFHPLYSDHPGRFRGVLRSESSGNQ